MTRFSYYTLILFSLVLSSELLAQSQPDNRMGIGISIDPARIGHTTYYYNGETSTLTEEVTNMSPILFYLPIRIMDSIRIEPLFGLYTMNSKNSSSTTSSTAYGTRLTATVSDASAYVIGVGIFYHAPLTKFFALYLGPRIDYTFFSSVIDNQYMSNLYTNYSSTENKTETFETDLTVGVAFGAEYFPVTHFSLGGEAGFNYTSFGNPDIKYTSLPQNPSSPETTNNERSQHSFKTDGIFFVRWYFL